MLWLWQPSWTAAGGRAAGLAGSSRPGHTVVASHAPRRLVEVIEASRWTCVRGTFATFDELAIIATRSPRPSGSAACNLGLSVQGGRAERLAEACGIALQLTNILRDVREDPVNGRIYLPEDQMARFGVAPRRLVATTQPGSTICWPFRGDGYAYYDQAKDLAAFGDPVGRPVLPTIVGIYRTLLDEIARRDYDVLFAERVALPSWRKVSIMLRSLFSGGFLGPQFVFPRGLPRCLSASPSRGSLPCSAVALAFASPSRVLIVGGGLAGLAAAAALDGPRAEDHLARKPAPAGSRASSFNDPVTGEPVDNCQHVSMACCTNLADFCGRVGTVALFRREPAVVFLGPDGQLSRLAAERLAGPLSSGGELPRGAYLSLSDKLRVAYGLARLRMATGPGQDGRASRLPTGCSMARADGPDDRTATGRPSSSRP